MSGTPITGDYIKAEGQAGRMGARLMAIVAEGDRGRVYLAPTTDHELAVRQAKPPTWIPGNELVGKCRDQLPLLRYGTRFADLFTPRQLVALTTFSDLVAEARARVERDAIVAGLPDDSTTSARAAAPGPRPTPRRWECIWRLVLIALPIDRQRSVVGMLVTRRYAIRSARQAIPMTWDYAEGNPSSPTQVWEFRGCWSGSRNSWWRRPHTGYGSSSQMDASSQDCTQHKVVSTDPPYYDNIGYADLSDFFYVWLRRSLRPVFPDLFATLAVPKAEELVATPYRHGSKERRKRFSSTA